MLRMQQTGEKSFEKKNTAKIEELALGIVSACEFLNRANNSQDRNLSIKEICDANFVQNHQCNTGLIEEIFLAIKKLSDKAGDNIVERNEKRKTTIYSAATDAILEWSRQYGDDVYSHLRQFKFDVSIGANNIDKKNTEGNSKNNSNRTSLSGTKKILASGLVIALGAGFIGPNLDKLKGFSLKKINRPNPIEYFSDKKKAVAPENDGWGKVLNIPKQLTDNRIVTNLDEGAMLYDQLNNEYMFWGIGTKNQSGTRQRPIVTLQIALEQKKIPLPQDFDYAYIEGTNKLDHKKNAIRFARLMISDQNQSVLIYKPQKSGTE